MPGKRVPCFTKHCIFQRNVNLYFFLKHLKKGPMLLLSGGSTGQFPDPIGHGPHSSSEMTTVKHAATRAVGRGWTHTSLILYLLTCVKRFAAVGQLTDSIRVWAEGGGCTLFPLWKPLLFNNPQKSICVSYICSLMYHNIWKQKKIIKLGYGIFPSKEYTEKSLLKTVMISI